MSKLDKTIKDIKENRLTGHYAIMRTNLGDVLIKLFPDVAPLTVANFEGLADGSKEWADPVKQELVKRPFYDGLIFHRVIPNFMIQGGCPLGIGRGGPGYQFKDEFNNKYQFDRPYILAMANSGPGTNGSQFFITVAPTPWLNNHHTIFGEVIQGADIVDKIALVKKDQMDKPVEPVVMQKVEILIGEVK